MTIANLIHGGTGPGGSIAGLILGGLEGGGGGGTGTVRTCLRDPSNILLTPRRPLISASSPTIWASASVGVAASPPIAFAWTVRGKLTRYKTYIANTPTPLPTLNATGLNGLPTVEFGGGTYVRNAADWVLGYSGRVVAVAKTTVTDADQVIYSQSDYVAADQYLHFGVSADNKIWCKYDNGAGMDVVELTGDTVLGTDWHVLEWASDDYAISMWVDGHPEVITVVSGTNNGYWFSDVTDPDFSVIGAERTNGYSTFLTGSIAELLVYSPDKTAAAVANIRSKLATKYDITMS